MNFKQVFEKEFRKIDCQLFCGDSNMKYRFAYILCNEVTYEASILRTFAFLKTHSDS